MLPLRVMEDAEWQLMSQATNLSANGCVKLYNRRVMISGGEGGRY